MLSRLKRLFQNKQRMEESNCHKLADLGQQDQQLFAKLTPFIWVQGKPILLVYNVEDEIYRQHLVTLPTLQQLEALGLILFEPNGFVKKGFGKHTRIFYGAKPTKIGFPEPMNNQLDLGQVLLTDLGKELAAASNIEGIKHATNISLVDGFGRVWFCHLFSLILKQFTRISMRVTILIEFPIFRGLNKGFGYGRL